jgi:hypothetical protein
MLTIKDAFHTALNGILIDLKLLTLTVLTAPPSRLMVIFTLQQRFNEP